MNKREYVLLIDDERIVAEGLSMLLERKGRTTIVCADVESAEIVLARYPITHVLSDVQFSGRFGFEGLHFLTRILHDRPDCRIVLMTGHATDGLYAAAKAMGAAALLAKPFGFEDLEAALQSTTTDEGAYEVVRIPPIEEVLLGGILTVAFQPIMQLRGGRAHAIAFEALARIRGTWPGGGIPELFEYAARRNRLADLNLAALRCAIAEGRHLPAGAALFINVDPMVFGRDDLTTILRSAAASANFPLSRIVLEITERSGLGTHDACVRAFDELREEGVRFALDDHGSAYSHLSRIDAIRPSFIKISSAFGTGFESDETRMHIVRNVVHLARDLGCRAILEGIESASTASAAVDLGIELAQGYHFGRPDAISRWTEAAAA